MERGFYNDEFEELLKQKADQYKMYPSDQVWKGIDRSLHTRKKWYWLRFVLFLAGITYYAIVQLISPSSATKKPIANINPSQSSAAANKTGTGKPAVVIPFSEQVRQTRAGKEASVTPTPRSFVLNPDNDNSFYSTEKIQPSAIIADRIEPVTIAETGRERNKEDQSTDHGKKSGLAKTLLSGNLTTIPAGKEDNLSSLEGVQLIATPDQPATENTAVEQKATSAADKKIVLDKGAVEDEQRISWLQQYAVYELPVPKTKRLSWQLSFSPTMNYRKLKGNDAAISSDVKNVPIAMSVASDPDKLVNHKPALGFELGSHFFYAVNKSLQIRVGAQFNYSRYAIKAYGSYHTDVATIALNSSPRREDSITNLTQIRNFGGDISEDLQNQYFQLSIPVGLQVRLLGNGKVQLGAAATIQPTYLINRNSYLITTDYKNYTKEPSLVRKWNLNSSAEIFITYKTGDLKWQIGPQFRYQLFSTYVKEYPIQEYMMEYGIKFGVTKTLR
jgi:hypothetical protein